MLFPLSSLLTTQRSPIERWFNRKEHVQPTKIGRVAVKNQIVVSEEHAQTGQLPTKIKVSVVVDRGATVGVQGDVVIVVEFIPKGRNPGKAPLHSDLELFDLGDRGARDDRKRSVSGGEMDQASRDVVHHARAVLAACVPIRVEHEVIHDQLTSSLEKIRECHGAFWPVEYSFSTLTHGQLAPSLGQPVALMFELLFPG